MAMNDITISGNRKLKIVLGHQKWLFNKSVVKRFCKITVFNEKLNAS